jgi:hypothetical protein
VYRLSGRLGATSLVSPCQLLLTVWKAARVYPSSCWSERRRCRIFRFPHREYRSLEVADLVTLKGGRHSSRARTEVPVRVGGANPFAFELGLKLRTGLYFARIVAWIVKKVFARASIVVVEKVKRVSCISCSPNGSRSSSSSVAWASSAWRPARQSSSWVATSFLALAASSRQYDSSATAPGWC